MADYIIKRGNRYSFKAVIHGKRIVQSLNTTIREVAVKRARALVRDLEQGRFDRVFAVSNIAAQKVATVGEIIERFKAAAEMQTTNRTRRNACSSLCRIVTLGLPTSDADAQPISVLTADLIFNFQRVVLQAHGPGHLEQDSAGETANSHHRQAASLFSKRALARNIYRGLELGTSYPGFCKAQKLTVLPKDNYQAPDKALVARLWQAAESDLRPNKPKVWVAFWIAAMAGLRKSEILGARWGWFSDDGVVVPLTNNFMAKGKRERLVPVVPLLRQRLLEVFTEQNWPHGPEDPLVLGENAFSRQRAFVELCRWMRSMGWARSQCTHELRKLFATAVCAGADSYTAQLALGHRNIQTTMRYAARPTLKAVDASAMWAGGPQA